MNIITGKKHINLDEFLKKPLFAHLSTVSKEGPRESPVWFYWENEQIYIIGTPPSDSFPGRIEENPACAIGIVDLDHTTGKVHHVGFRGKATVETFDKTIATKLLKRYLGPNEENWDPRFQGLGNSNVLIKFVPESVVVRDQSFVPSI
ncbi:pyridoxamine 5'-phosphate oxidase family protein [Bacillus sp. BHET2]|uniref:pyridoxamine 5'-phosphate oxidase family protein n=1 Tax=Bacillus sp. BHET2 TaxID=2583818 RepID=UPI00110ED441|nr:pyridoxamine 5'-phosphate oxidase family protein [Bacillus sp. BHET2]TMU85823.1 pyridoxamine 5'-phosphate oxidase family protein [Bacillus sp. BHET2]